MKHVSQFANAEDHVHSGKESQAHVNWRPRPSANRLGEAARPARRRGDREQEVVELNSKLPVRAERHKSKKI